MVPHLLRVGRPVVTGSVDQPAPWGRGHPHHTIQSDGQSHDGLQVRTESRWSSSQDSFAMVFKSGQRWTSFPKSYQMYPNFQPAKYTDSLFNYKTRYLSHTKKICLWQPSLENFSKFTKLLSQITPKFHLPPKYLKTSDDNNEHWTVKTVLQCDTGLMCSTEETVWPTRGVWTRSRPDTDWERDQPPPGLARTRLDVLAVSEEIISKQSP